MKILFYLHQFPGFGGMETIAATLAKEFTQRGHQIYFLAHRKGRGTSLMTKLPVDMSVFYMPDSKRLVSKGNKNYLREVVSKNGIDIVLYRDSYAPIERNLLGENIGANVITSEHNAPFFCYLEAHPQDYTFWNRVKTFIRTHKVHLPYYYESRRKRYLYDHSDLYVLLSNRFYGDFKAVARLFDCRKLRAINNPLAPELKPLSVNLEHKENLMVFAATLSVEKGAMRALRALAMLKERKRIPAGWRVEILGDGPERCECEKFIEERGLDFVNMLGYVANPQPYYARAKVLLFPSSREGFGNVLFEAMANGCVPVAFSSYAAIFDIVTNLKDGILVDAFDLEKYASAIESLINDDVAWRSMAQQAVVTAERFDVKKIADQWEELFVEVKGGRE